MSMFFRRAASVGWEGVLLVLFLLWVVPFVVIYPKLMTPFDVPVERKVSARLNRAVADLDALKVQNQELLEIVKGISYMDMKSEQKQALENFQERLLKMSDSQFSTDSVLVPQKEEPSLQYEVLRRRIQNNIQEFWFYIDAELQKVSAEAKSTKVSQQVEKMLNLAGEHKRLLMHNMRELSDADGYANWREKESADLTKLVQDRFHYLQNPPDCKTAKKLSCNLSKGCGYGCQLHHAVYCFIVAYGTQRTFILKSKGWRYHKGGWEDIFRPLSETCTDASGTTTAKWPGTVDTQVLTLPIIDSVNPKPPYLPLAIPEDLAPRLTRLHGDPAVWWVGQVLKYLVRAQPKTAEQLRTSLTNMGFQRPIVGVHVRRTDKIYSEASFHALDEYMREVDEYYAQLELREKVTRRRIYLASDDPKVFGEAQKKYGHYEILGDEGVARAAGVATRYSDQSLQGIVLDIHMLSMCDYLVCTFSSQVCRVAYEIMQTYYTDASARFRSLDDVYYFGGQLARNEIAVLAHEAQTPDEIDLQPGDEVGIAGNHWNGFTKGTNRRTQQTGLFPGFKIRHQVRTAPFPTYAEMRDEDANPDDI